MAQFDYLGTWGDLWAMLRIIEEREDFTYFPDLNYAQAKPRRFSSVTSREYRDLVRGNLGASRVYIWSAAFSWDTVVMHRCEGPRGYNIEQSQPILGLRFPGDFVELSDGTPLWNPDLDLATQLPRGATRKLQCGMLWYQDEYPDPRGRWVKRSPELKAAYQRVCSHMKKVMVRHKFNRYVWIGREAHRLVKEGKVQVIAHV
jgi:hypothetical protein